MTIITRNTMSVRTIFIHTLALSVALLSGCGPNNDSSSIAAWNLKAYTPAYAAHFTIDSCADASSVIITVTDPWQGAGKVSERLFVCRDGETAPEGFDGQVLSAPPHRVVAMSSTHIAMLEAIGADSTLAGAAGTAYINSERVKNRIDSISDIGYEGNVNYERLAALNPDLVLLYGINGSSSMVPRLRQMGIPYLYVGDYLEESPLGKAEWMVAVAEAMGCRARGDSAFAPIPERYKAIATQAAAASTRPKVMLNAPYADAWMLPPEGSYAVQLINDAGGEYAGPRNTTNASAPIGSEEAYLLLDSSDKWINVGSMSSLSELRRLYPRLSETAPVTKGEVYNNTLRSIPGGGNDYYESGVVHPDLILRDLVKILHPELVSEDFVYYRRLPEK